MNKYFLIGLLVVVVCFAGGWFWYRSHPVAPTANTPATSNPMPAGAVPKGVEAARRTLADKLKILPSDIVILEAHETEWSDGCLGLGGPAESCIFMLTPGYNVLLQAQGKDYRYRTDLEGNAVRFEKIEGEDTSVSI
jgi:hypothetical protein